MRLCYFIRNNTILPVKYFFYTLSNPSQLILTLPSQYIISNIHYCYVLYFHCEMIHSSKLYLFSFDLIWFWEIDMVV